MARAQSCWTTTAKQPGGGRTAPTVTRLWMDTPSNLVECRERVRKAGGGWAVRDSYRQEALCLFFARSYPPVCTPRPVEAKDTVGGLLTLEGGARLGGAVPWRGGLDLRQGLLLPSVAMQLMSQHAWTFIEKPPAFPEGAHSVACDCTHLASRKRIPPGSGSQPPFTNRPPASRGGRFSGLSCGHLGPVNVDAPVHRYTFRAKSRWTTAACNRLPNSFSLNRLGAFQSSRKVADPINHTLPPTRFERPGTLGRQIPPLGFSKGGVYQGRRPSLVDLK